LIITDSSVGMDSKRSYTSVSMDAYTHSRSVSNISAKDFLESLSGALSGNTTSSEKENTELKTDKTEEGESALSGNAEGSLEYLKGKFNEITTSKLATMSKTEEDFRSMVRYMCLNFLLILLFGKNGLDDGDSLLSKAIGLSDGFEGFNLSDAMAEGNVIFTETKESFKYEHYEREYEATGFTANGIVKTADGREIDFDINLTMSRRFESLTKEVGVYEQFSAKLVDPLVINFDGPAAMVTDQNFYFDIDSDGTLDAVSRLTASSGFLALDLNEDGEINDGTELFGTKSGDGFRDLSKYDQDGNGWIDEADEIFDKLKIMCVNDDGSTSLYSIKEKGVGAICLGSKETEFSVTNDDNRINAQIRKTGLFLYETGIAGTVQHVDLSVELGA